MLELLFISTRTYCPTDNSDNSTIGPVHLCISFQSNEYNWYSISHGIFIWVPETIYPEAAIWRGFDILRDIIGLFPLFPSKSICHNL